jgi:selenocysteine lyase/cysteine desulfurase
VWDVKAISRLFTGALLRYTRPMSDQAGPLSWDVIRAKFPIAERKIPLIDGSEAPLLYLDHAASTHSPSCVLERYTRFMTEEYANIHRGTHLLSRVATRSFDECYTTVADFIGGDLDSGAIVFLGNTTQAIDLVAHVVDPLPGKVLVTELEHHSNDLPYRKRGPLLRARVDAEGRLDLDHVRDLLRSNIVKLVAVTGASNVTGWMPDIHALARLAHEHGALISVDCAQLLAHQKIDVRDVDHVEHLDFVAAAGHKAYAPFGSSFLYGPRWLLDEAPPYLPGGGTASRVSARRVEFVGTPDHHQGGTPNIGGVIAMAESLRFLAKVGMDRVREHEREMTVAAMTAMRAMEGVTVYGPPEPEARLGVVSFNVEGVSDLLAAAALSEERGIACRNGRFCAHIYVDRLLASQGGYAPEPGATPGAVRASFGIYNTMADVERLLEGVEMLRSQAWKGRYRVLGPDSGEVVQAELASRCNDRWMTSE